jgi:hypothetical protein
MLVVTIILTFLAATIVATIEYPLTFGGDSYRLTQQPFYIYTQSCTNRSVVNVTGILCNDSVTWPSLPVYETTIGSLVSVSPQECDGGDGYCLQWSRHCVDHPRVEWNDRVCERVPDTYCVSEECACLRTIQALPFINCEYHYEYPPVYGVEWCDVSPLANVSEILASFTPCVAWIDGFHDRLLCTLHDASYSDCTAYCASYLPHRACSLAVENTFFLHLDETFQYTSDAAIAEPDFDSTSNSADQLPQPQNIQVRVNTTVRCNDTTLPDCVNTVRAQLQHNSSWTVTRQLNNQDPVQQNSVQEKNVAIIVILTLSVVINVSFLPWIWCLRRAYRHRQSESVPVVPPPTLTSSGSPDLPRVTIHLDIAHAFVVNATTLNDNAQLF